MFFSSFLDEAHWKSSERKINRKFSLENCLAISYFNSFSVFLFLSLFNLLLITFICFPSHLSLSWLSNSNRPGFLLCSYALFLASLLSQKKSHRSEFSIFSPLLCLSFQCEKLFALNQSRHYFSLSSLLSHIRKTQKKSLKYSQEKFIAPFFSCICSNCKKRK